MGDERTVTVHSSPAAVVKSISAAVPAVRTQARGGSKQAYIERVDRRMARAGLLVLADDLRKNVLPLADGLHKNVLPLADDLHKNVLVRGREGREW